MKNVIQEEKSFSLFNNSIKYYVGGHSKGGHLVIYSSIHMSQNIHDKIIKIYNFDGPVLDEITMEHG